MTQLALQLEPAPGPHPFLEAIAQADLETSRMLLSLSFKTEHGSSAAIAVAHAEEYYWFRRGGVR